MDKASIFTELTQRNALRKAAGLLDIPTEYAREVSVAEWQDYRRRWDEHAEEREVIRGVVLAELRHDHDARAMGRR